MQNVVRIEFQRKESLDPIETSFEHWKEIMGYRRARLDQKRRKCIADRLKDGYSLEDLIDAINGCYLSPFHQGDNERNTRYDDIELICRNASNVDKFIQLYEDSRSRLQRAEEKAAVKECSPATRESAKAHLDAIRKAIKF